MVFAPVIVLLQAKGSSCSSKDEVKGVATAAESANKCYAAGQWDMVILPEVMAILVKGVWAGMPGNI